MVHEYEPQVMIGSETATEIGCATTEEADHDAPPLAHPRPAHAPAAATVAHRGRGVVGAADGRVVEHFQWLATHDWAMVTAVTETGTVLVERCFKPGIGRLALLLPAGAIDAGEAPEAAMRRELLEETGYAADDWTALGSFRLDPNYGVSTGHLFLARGARRVAEPDGRDLEEIEVVELALGDALAAARSGELASMGSAACLALAALVLSPS